MSRNSLLVIALFGIVGIGCTGPNSAIVGEDAVAQATSTAPFLATSVPTTTFIADGVDVIVHEAITPQMADLGAAAQTLRGIQFIRDPQVLILPHQAFADRLAKVVDTDLTRPEVELEELRLRMIGQHDMPWSIYEPLRELFTDASAFAFYDPLTRQVVVKAVGSELSPLQKSIAVRAFASALIDQFHNVYTIRRDLKESGNSDALDAYTALMDGDVIATQLRYLQQLPESEQDAAALEAMESQPPQLGRLPASIVRALSLPAGPGVDFVEYLVAEGGYRRLDQAYGAPPVSTEQLLHIESYLDLHPVRMVPDLAVELSGYETAASGALGEWGLSLLLADAIDSGTLTQTVSGWGGDAYQLLVGADDAYLFIYTYGADSEEDAIEVAQALLALASGPMSLGSGFERSGGVEFANGGQHMFVDRIADGLVAIIATSSSALEEAKTQVSVP